MKTIPCSVGILTFNSEKTLQRALESVKDFSNIIISDGGSTDSTLDIARQYGCVIAEQYTKNNPGPNKYHPIEDFARERNLILDIATEDWYLWIDSDEYISNELHEEIRSVCAEEKISHFAYEIPIALQSPDASVTYKRVTPMYQMRFFNQLTNGKFMRIMHERYVFNKHDYLTGRFRGSWCVPLSKPDFMSYRRAVNYRLRILLKETVITNFYLYFKKAILVPLKRTAGVFYRYLSNKIKFKHSEAVPFFYYRNQLYSNWVTFKVISELYFKRKTPNDNGS